ncbi:MAG: transposase domain-containing protein [Janthinobacterium lividum]
MRYAACRPGPTRPGPSPTAPGAGRRSAASSTTAGWRSTTTSPNARCAASPSVVGRRNWLFAGSRQGGERAAAIYTVIQTCKANGVDPQAYIADVIARVADDWPASRWDELMPWNWGAATDQHIAQAA